MKFLPRKNWADNGKFPSKFEDVSPSKNGEYPASQVGFLSCGMVKVPGSQPESGGKMSQDSRFQATTTPGPWKLTAGSPKNHRTLKRNIIWTKPPWLWVQNVNFPGFSGAKFPKDVWCFNTFYTHRIHVIICNYGIFYLHLLVKQSAIHLDRCISFMDPSWDNPVMIRLAS